MAVWMSRYRQLRFGGRQLFKFFRHFSVRPPETAENKRRNGMSIIQLTFAARNGMRPFIARDPFRRIKFFKVVNN
jgi:hypothetical protein